MRIAEIIQEVVEEAVREGSTKDQLMTSLVDKLDLERLVTEALNEEKDRLEEEQGDLRVYIEQLDEDEEEEEIQEKEADWDLLEESIQDAEHLLLRFD